MSNPTDEDEGYFDCCDHCSDRCRSGHVEGCTFCDDPSVVLDFQGWDDPDDEDD